MNELTFTPGGAEAVVRVMLDLAMLEDTRTPEQPTRIQGRDHACVEAELGLPTVVLDDELRTYLDSYHAYLAWCPEDPKGLSGHKFASFGWVLTPKEVSAALRVMRQAPSGRVAVAVATHFARKGLDQEPWDDWTKILLACADSRYPILLAEPGYEGPRVTAELLREQAWHMPDSA